MRIASRLRANCDVVTILYTDFVSNMALRHHHANRLKILPSPFSWKVTELINRIVFPHLDSTMTRIGCFKLIMGNGVKIILNGCHEIILNKVAKISLVPFQRKQIVSTL